MINRDAAARFGLNISAIVQDLYDAFGQRQIATIYWQIYQYKVIVEVAPEYRNTAEALDSLYLQESRRAQPPATNSSNQASSSTAKQSGPADSACRFCASLISA